MTGIAIIASIGHSADVRGRWVLSHHLRDKRRTEGAILRTGHPFNILNIVPALVLIPKVIINSDNPTPRSLRGVTIMDRDSEGDNRVLLDGITTSQVRD
jgi:hypothetical protein